MAGTFDPDPDELLARFLEVHPDCDPATFSEWAEATLGPGVPEEVLEATLARVRERRLELDALGLEHWEPAPLTDALAPSMEGSGMQPVSAGDLVGPFRLEELLGQGGMGQVWRATDLELGRAVALKLVLPGRATARGLERFQREARAGARVVHPHIVATHRTGFDDGRAWIAQELVPGGRTLRTLISEFREGARQEEPGYEEAALLVAKVAEALEAAHREGVVHRDLKPSNVLLSMDGEPRLTDFGLARLQDDSFESVTGEGGGTWAYMSPEQVAARRQEIDHRTDVFSLGVVLYELLTQQRPFEGDTAAQLTDKILREDPVPTRELRSQCPVELSVICAKAMEKRPQDRYPTAAAFAEDLRAFLAHEPIAARPASASRRIRNWCRRHPIRASVLSVATVALAVISVLAVQNGELAEQRARALARVDAERASFIAQAARSSLDLGRSTEAVARLQRCPPELRDFEWDHLRLLADPSTRTVPLAAALLDLDWSPDGERVAAATWGSDVLVLDLEEGAAVQRFVGHEARPRCVRWSPAGDRLASGANDRSVRVWVAGTGECSHVLEGHEDFVEAVAWVEDGRGLLSAGRDRRVLLWDLEAGTSSLVLEADADVFSLGVAPDGGLLAVGCIDGTIRLWDLEAAEQVRILEGHTYCVTGLAWHPDGAPLASSSYDNTARLWDVAGGGEARVLAGHTKEIDGLAWSPDGSTLATAGWDMTVRTWDAVRGEPIAVLTGHAKNVTAVAWSPDGTRLGSVGWDGALRTWRAPTGAIVPELSIGGRDLREVTPNPTGDRLLVAAQEYGALSGALAVVTAATLAVEFVVEEPSAQVGIHAWSPDGARFAYGLWDGRVSVRQASDGTEAFVLEGHEDRLHSLEWMPGGSVLPAGGGGVLPAGGPAMPGGGRVLTGSGDGTARLWDGASGDVTAVLDPGVPGATVARASASGAWVATSSADGTVRLWRPATGDLEQEWRPGGGVVTAMTWSASEDLLAIGCMSGAIEVLRPGASAPVLQASLAEGPVTALRWSPEGERLASGSPDGPRVWDLATGASTLEPSGDYGDTVGLAWHPAGRRLATMGSWDDSVQLWDVETGEPVAAFRGSDEIMGGLAWGAGGRALVTVAGPRLSIWGRDLASAADVWRFEQRTRALEPVVERLTAGQLHRPRTELLALLDTQLDVDEDEREVLTSAINRLALGARALVERAQALQGEQGSTEALLAVRYTARAVELLRRELDAWEAEADRLREVVPRFDSARAADLELEMSYALEPARAGVAGGLREHARALVRDGRTQEAREALDEALELAADSQRFELGRLRASLGEGD